MASRLLHPALFSLRGPLLFGGASISAAVLCAPLLLHRRPLLLDSSPVSVSPRDWSYSQYQTDAKVPITTKSGKFDARSVRLVAGLGISMFSKTLVILLGLGVVAVQTAESYGIRLIPYKTMQKYVKNIDLRSAVQDNVAFKISFGLMFALSAFAQL